MRLALDGGVPVRAAPLDYQRGVTQIGAEERQAVLEVLESRSLFRYYGPDLRHKVEGLERGVVQQLGVPYALATSSGTGALRAALAALGVGPGDEVVVPALTFIASANAVVTSGAVPVFADVDDSLGMDPASLRSVLSPRTAAIMPVHLENVVCDMDAILPVAGSVPVIEDACQAIGASYHGTAAGGLGAMGAFSLQLEKNITAGEGGVLVTADPELHLRAARYTDQGGQFVTAHGGVRGTSEVDPFVGANLRMTELAGAVAGVQLGRLPGLLDAMRANKAKLLAMIGAVDGLTPRWIPDPDGEAGSSITWFAPAADVAARFVDALLAEGIPSARLYDGEPVYANRSLLERRTVTPKRSPWAAHPVDVRYELGMCPRAEDLAARSVIVAVGPGYTAGDLEDVATAVAKVAAALL
jgi:8-amino-3,8-dideoxy-alpha-D-manno-octulosonate transaminase